MPSPRNLICIDIKNKHIYYIGYSPKAYNLFNYYLYFYEDDIKDAVDNNCINDELNPLIRNYCISKDTIEFETFKIDKADYKKYGKKIKIIRQKK